MWITGYIDTVNPIDGMHRIAHVYPDGGTPRSMCQALRLVREHFVRMGIENDRKIIQCELIEDDQHLPYTNVRVLTAQEGTKWLKPTPPSVAPPMDSTTDTMAQ